MPHKVQDNLIAAKLLSVIGIENIQTESTVKERNSKMYQIILTHVKTVCDRVKTKEAVCKGLCESAQYCPLSKKEKPASENQKEILENLRPQLVEDPDLAPVLDRLIQAGIIDHHLRDLIDAKISRRDKWDALLVILSHTHSRAHDQFIEILKETKTWVQIQPDLRE